MRRIKGAKPSPALLVAVVALVAALGGGAVAGVAVTALNKQEKKQVKEISKKQANKAVKGIPAGPKGDQGPKGDPGANGATDVTRRISALTTVAADNTGEATASCEPGERAVGGGGIPFNGGTLDFDMMGSVPITVAIFSTRECPLPGRPGTRIETSATATPATFSSMRMPSARPRRRGGLRATTP